MVKMPPLQVKDANAQTQSIATGADNAGNLVPEHVETALVMGVAVPVSPSAPLPVINAAGAPAVDGSGTIGAGGTAQPLFSGATPANGFLVANNHATAKLWVSDVGAATEGGASIPIAAGGGLFVTPDGYRPAGPVSIIGDTTGSAFAARRW
jgi:hypothetical protein